MFRPHSAVCKQHILMEPTALCSLMSIVLVDVRLHYSQFWYFENVCSFSIFVLRLVQGTPNYYKVHKTKGVAHTKGAQRICNTKREKEQVKVKLSL
jgi:hypothetical protein